MVGLGDAAVQEAADRIESHCQFEFPWRKIVYNLAPSHRRKSGTHFDLAMALALLFHTDQAALPKQSFGCIGELALDGELRPVTGVLPMADAAQKAGLDGLIVPAANLAEANLVPVPVYAFHRLEHIIHFLRQPDSYNPPNHSLPRRNVQLRLDFADVQGQEGLSPYIAAAAAGGHNF